MQPPLCCCHSHLIVTAWTRGPCCSVTRCLPGPPATQTLVGDGSPLASVLAVVQRCPGPHLPSFLPGPLALSGFTICLVRSTWPLQGCPWGQLSPSPSPASGITLRVSVSESDLEASFYSFLSPGRDLSSLGCGCRSQTDGSSPESP